MSSKFKASIFNGLTFKQFTGVQRAHIFNESMGLRAMPLGEKEIHVFVTDGAKGAQNDKYLGTVRLSETDGKVIFEPA